MSSPVNLLGNFAIAAALLSSILGIVITWIGIRFDRPELRRVFSWSAYLNFAAMTIANLVMVYALLTNDFSVSYVAHVGAVETPRFFAAISLWSSLEGSILLWGWVLSGYTALCVHRFRSCHPERSEGSFGDSSPFDKLRAQNDSFVAWVGITLLSIALFFYIVLAIPANPFQTVFPIPENGPGPNPLLQNHWLMALHPPMLYLGYVGMSVPFSFAIASIITGSLTDQWVSITRRWTLTAWTFLSVAIIFGGWWSYEVLGWGGYWAWDPVENASFMPWLTGTAFLHSVMVQERRQMLKLWNLSLIIITFLLTILGTFLTRSGVLESVHSFTQSSIGHYFLIFIAIALSLSAALLLWNGRKLESTGKLDSPFSRETFFLLNNLLFVCFCWVVLLGTLYPLIVEALRGIKVSVGEPFFNQMTVPLAIGLIILMGIGSAVPWKEAKWKTLQKLFFWPLILAATTTLVSYFLEIRKTYVLITIAATTFSFSIMGMEMAFMAFKVRSPWRIFSINPRRYGGFVVHIGIIIIALAIALSGSYKTEQQRTLKEGEQFQIGQHVIQFMKLRAEQKPQRFEIVAEMNVDRKPMRPRLNFYPNNREPIGSPHVRSTWKEDIYLTLMAFDPDRKEATIRAIVTPAVSWIWMGGGIIVVGVLIALCHSRTLCHSRESGNLVSPKVLDPRFRGDDCI